MDCKVCTKSKIYPTLDLCFKCAFIISDEFELSKIDLTTIMEEKIHEQDDMIVQVDPEEIRDICKICEEVFCRYSQETFKNMQKICQNCESKGAKYISKYI